MRISRIPTLAALALTAFVLARPALAHHSYAMFDLQKNVTLEGTVKEVQWTNPHIWIQLMVKDATTGNEVEWSIEGASPNMLVRAGWTRSAIKAGDKAVMVIHPVIRSSNRNSGSLAEATVDGKRIFARQGSIPVAETK